VEAVKVAPASRSPLLLGFAAFVVFAAAGLHYVEHLQASGDEPHYLLMAGSLWQEHDLDLRDNAEREEYRDYVPGPLEPHYGWPRRDGRPFPAHSPGLPFLLAPAVAAAGRHGAVLVMALLAAGLVVEASRWGLLLSPDREDVALWASLLLAISPLFFYSFHVYTEVPSALAAWWALRLVWERRDDGRVALAALLASSLPWLHLKMAPAAVVIGIVAMIRLRGKRRVLFAAICGAMAAGLLEYFRGIHGGFVGPLSIYGGASGAVATGNPVRGLVGLLLDRSYGLLPYAPSLVVALGATPRMARMSGGALAPAMALGAAIVLPAILWRQWWGGMCPPARLLVPALPLLACLAAVRRFDRPPGLLARALVPLAGIQTALVLFAVWRPEDRLLLNRTDRPSRLWTALGGDFPLGDWLPSVAGTNAWTGPTLAWIAMLGVFLAWDCWAVRSQPGGHTRQTPLV
jgi:hypothetical protein